MLKEELLSENFQRICRNQHQLLYTKPVKQGLHIRVLVLDCSITGEENPPVTQSQIDNSKDVYQLFISNQEKQNLRIFRMLKGTSGLNSHLIYKANWELDIQKKLFKILYKGQQIKQFQIKRSQIFNFFSQNDIVNILKQKNKFKPNQLSYILAKSLIINQEEKQGKPRLSRIDLQHNKRQRIQSTIKQKNKKQKSGLKDQQKKSQMKSQKKSQIKKQQQEMIQENAPDERKAQMSIVKSKTTAPKYLFSDSVGFNSFEFINRQIIKQRQEDELCIYGSTSIVYKDYFTISLKKLSKQEGRYPVIWIGFADLEQRKKHKNLDTMQKHIVMGDKKKIKVCKKILWKDVEEKFIDRQFYQGDIITVKADRQSGIVTWTEVTKGVRLGSCSSELVTNAKNTLVPIIQLWKNGDIVQWID